MSGADGKAEAEAAFLESLQTAVRDALMFGPPGTSANSSNVQPVIQDRGSRIYEYFKPENWTFAERATVVSESPVFILSHPQAAAASASSSSSSSSSAAAPVPFAHIRALDETNLFKAVSDVAVASPVPAESEQGQGHDFEHMLEQLDVFAMNVAIKYAEHETGGAVTLQASSFGLGLTERTSQAVTYFSRDFDDKESHLYGVLDADRLNSHIDDVLSGARVYYAFRALDRIFEDQEDYFFFERLIILTKVLYVLNLLRMAARVTGANVEPLKREFYNIARWVYFRDIKGYVNSANDKETGLDDMFQENVKKGHEIREMSDKLVERKHHVKAIQDNLKTAENSDRLAKRQRRNMIILYAVAAAFLAALVACLAFMYVRGYHTGLYLVCGATASLVLGLEAYSGIGRVLNA